MTNNETLRRLATQWLVCPTGLPDGAWTLRKTTADLSEAEVIHTSVRFIRRIPIRLAKLLSVGLDMSRSEVHRLIADGNLSSTHRLTGKSSGDFSFTLRRKALLCTAAERGRRGRPRSPAPPARIAPSRSHPVRRRRGRDCPYR